MEVSLGISSRHIHLNEEDFKILFGNIEMQKVKKLRQKGQYSSNLTLKIKTEKSEIDRVRVIGPIRKYTQLEISKTDSYTLGINPPIRESGNLSNAEEVILIGPNGRVNRKCAIISERHIHLNFQDVIDKNLSGINEVCVEFKSDKSTIFQDVALKVSDDGVWELHLDTDEANAASLKNGDIGKVLISK